jgi:putative ABC transport system substrate-binding protein
MRRRDFITLFGVAAMVTVPPLAARAQLAGKSPTIRFLGAVSATGFANQIAGFREGLRDLGYVEGTSIKIEYRWAEGNYARLPELVADLIRANVALIVTHGTPGTLAAKRATATIPIVAAVIGDPISTGVVASIARPEGNITGQSFFNPELRAKRIELLKEVMPNLADVAILSNPDSPAIVPESREIEGIARSLNLGLQQYLTRSPSEFDSAFEKMQQAGIVAVEIGDDALMNANLGMIAALATKRRLLMIGPRESAQAGGLIGFGIDFPATYRRAATFVDRILKGAKPADLPFEQATKFEFVINLKTAKALGLDVPAATLLRADRVIE